MSWQGTLVHDILTDDLQADAKSFGFQMRAEVAGVRVLTEEEKEE